MPSEENGPCLEIEISREFSPIYPGSSVGVLVLDNVRVQSHNTNLDGIIRGIVLDLQKQFPNSIVLKEHPLIKAYSSYYKKFKKSYHVLGQMESTIFEKRPLPSGSALVETIFAAELRNILLTAIYDLDAIDLPLEISISSGEEIYTTLRGNEQRLKPGDMITRDQKNVVSSVIYGPDKRTCVKSSTKRVVVIVYAPYKKRSNCQSLRGYSTHHPDILAKIFNCPSGYLSEDL